MLGLELLPRTLPEALDAFEASGVMADAIVVTRAMKASTIAEIFIEEHTIRVELEIGIIDVPAFHNIMPRRSAALPIAREQGTCAGPAKIEYFIPASERRSPAAAPMASPASSSVQGR